MKTRRIPDWKCDLIYDKLVEAAENGERCPTNNDLAFLINAYGTADASNAIRQLEEAGRVSVQRFRRSRTVTITETGKSTLHVPEGYSPKPKASPVKPRRNWGMTSPSPIPVDSSLVGAARNHLRKFYSNVFSASIAVSESDRRTWAEIQNAKYDLGIPDKGRGFTFVSGMNDIFSDFQIVEMARQRGWKDSAHAA